MPLSLQAFAMVGLGGAAGAMARFGMTLAALRFGHSAWLGTLSANLLGCLVMGALAQALVRPEWFASDAVALRYRLLFSIGFCGAFTTLSAFVFEMSEMLQRNAILPAFAYLLVTVIGGFAAFWSGAALVRGL